MESNPGPSTEALLSQLLAGQNKLADEVAAIRAQQNNMEKLMADWVARFSELEKRVARVGILENTVKSLEAKLTDIEDKSRRSNLVVFGIPEEAQETDSMLKSKILDDVFSKKLDVQCKSIGRIHRLGRPGKKRPVIIYFKDYNEKQQILKNAYKLKGTVISLQNDYSHTTLRKRKLLWDSARSEKQRGKKKSV